MLIADRQSHIKLLYCGLWPTINFWPILANSQHYSMESTAQIGVNGEKLLQLEYTVQFM